MTFSVSARYPGLRALREKRRALGRALAADVAGDDAKVDDELMFLRAVADIDTPYIRLLARMAGPPAAGWHGWDAGTIQSEDPGLGDAWLPVLNTLVAHLLVQELRSSTPWQGSRTRYEVTSLGRAMLARLADEEKATAG